MKFTKYTITITLLFCLLCLTLSANISGERKRVKATPYDGLMNAKYIMYGYDVRKADLFKTEIDPGLIEGENPIFELSWKEWAKKNKKSTITLSDPTSAPDGIVISRLTGSTSSSKSSEIKSQSEYRSDFAASLNIDLSIAGATFSASASYSTLRTDTLTNNKKYTYNFHKCTKFEIQIETSKINTSVKFTTAFKADVLSLPNVYTETPMVKKKFKDFFEKYGTHYIKRMQLGGRRLDVVTQDVKTVGNTNSQTTTLGVGAPSIGPIGGKASTSFGSGSSQSSSQNNGNAHYYVSGVEDCSDNEGLMPVSYTLAKLTDLIKEKLGKDITGLNGDNVCKLIEGSWCTPLDPIVAVVDIKHVSSSSSASQTMTELACPFPYEDVTKLVLNTINDKHRVNFHSGHVGDYQYLCQLKKNIVNVDGTFQDYITFDANVGTPMLYDSSDKIPSGSKCITKKDKPYDLNEGFSPRDRFLCWTMANTYPAIAPLMDLAIDGNTKRYAFSTECDNEVIIHHKQYTSGAWTDYDCSCWDLNGRGLVNFYTICYSKTKNPLSGKKKKMMKK